MLPNIFGQILDTQPLYSVLDVWVFLPMIVVWMPHGVPLTSSQNLRQWGAPMWAFKKKKGTKWYPNRKYTAVPAKWNIFTHISRTCTYTHIYIYIHRQWDTISTLTDTNTHTVLNGSHCCSIIEQPWCNWQHAFWHVTSIHRQRRCRKMSHTPLAASFLLLLYQDICLSATQPSFRILSVFFTPFLIFKPACIYVFVFPFPPSPPLHLYLSKLTSCVSLQQPLSHHPLPWVLCFTEAGCPNLLWHSYLSLPCYCSFHPTAPTLPPL